VVLAELEEAEHVVRVKVVRVELDLRAVSGERLSGARAEVGGSGRNDYDPCASK
jgi:hypothetical protein